MLLNTILLLSILLIVILLCIIFRIVDYILDNTFDNDNNDFFTMQRLDITRDNKSIYGTLCLPSDDKKKYPLVILAHGFGVNHKSMIKYSRMVVREGFASFTFDFLGGSSFNYSDGDMEDMSVLTEEKDLKEIVDYIKKLDYIDEDNVYLLGHSQGAVVCALYASNYPDEIKKLFLINPAFILVDHTKENEIPKKGDALVKYDEVQGRKYFLDGRKIELYDSFTNFKGEVHIFHGENDKVVPLIYSKKARRAYKDAYIYIMNDEGHMISESGIKKIIDIVSKKINSRKN